MSVTGGNKKASKAGQPKRKRYLAEKRGWKRRIKTLERHVGANPGDRQAPDALKRLKTAFLGI